MQAPRLPREAVDEAQVEEVDVATTIHALHLRLGSDENDGFAQEGKDCDLMYPICNNIYAMNRGFAMFLH